MAALQREQRQSLERTIVSARSASEAAARAAIATLAVKEEKPHPQMSEDERRLRRALRAKSRQLGGNEALIAEIAYQHWHRMLFSRFLAENGLLIYPDSAVAISLEEVAELAREEGLADPWVTAAQFAAAMLPAIFRAGDPTLELRFAPEGRQTLEELLSSLPKDVFVADDSLGWVYQFWQSEKKKVINKTGVKIGAAELPAVTQLFTEDYLVRFLLENSLGAWWAVRHPESRLQNRFSYLRFGEADTLAAGTFEGWPESPADVTVMDPCCGSGHFLTVAFEMLTAMRMEEEGLSVAEAGDAVIRDNLFGLEVDPRCAQIAAFALALLAWRHGGYRRLPAPSIACSGIPVGGQLADWKTLAGEDQRLEPTLGALHEQFRNAPDLGSLIDPRRRTDQGHLFTVNFEQVAPLLETLLSRENDPEMEVAGWAAAGIAKAASLLARTYTVVATNPPFLGRAKQSRVIADLTARYYKDSRNDLGVVFLERCIQLSEGTYALVLPQSWLALKRYSHLRQTILRSQQLRIVVWLGEGAFENAAAAGAFVSLLIGGVHRGANEPSSSVGLLDIRRLKTPAEKAVAMKLEPVVHVQQMAQLHNPEARILPSLVTGALLRDLADTHQGIKTADNPRFVRTFWEFDAISHGWRRMQSAPLSTASYTGREHVAFWEDGYGAMALVTQEGATFRGQAAWDTKGVVVGEMRSLYATLYTGELFDGTGTVVIPRNPRDLAALWAFASSKDFFPAVRRIDNSLKVTSGTLLDVPLDPERWQEMAEKIYPNGLPAPHSNDPTQWLFNGDPKDASDPLQVAVARLLGYGWPNQEGDSLVELADSDGAVCVPAVAGEASAPDRLRALLSKVWGRQFSADLLHHLLIQAGASTMDLETWLRDEYFIAHAKLFQNRPFVWHVWDGRRDGFSAFVNYHRLDLKLLNRITYTLLGAWIELQADQVRRAIVGAENRMAAARDLQRKLELIAQGEPPFDIYVRWKSLSEQPIGWNPDLNDGVRVNIRPFVRAGILRTAFSINWTKDRGNNSDGSERINDRHFTREQKESFRRRDGRTDP